MAKPKLSYEAARSAAERDKFFAGQAQSAPTSMGTMGDYSEVTSGVGPDRRYDADITAKLNQIAQNLGGAAAPVAAAGVGAGGGGAAGGQPQGNKPPAKKKKDKDDGLEGGVETEPIEDSTSVRGSEPSTTQKMLNIDLSSVPTIEGLGTVSNLLKKQFEGLKQDKKYKDKMDELYPNMGQPDRFDNL
jgi:hypothetical protein